MKKHSIACALSALALHAGAATLFYETAVPTADILAYENENHQNLYTLDGGNFGGQTFTAIDNSTVTELWFQSAGTVALDGSATLAVTFWNNSNEAGNDWTLDATLPAADSTLLGTYSLPAGNLTAFDSWIRIVFDAADQTAIGELTPGHQYGFSISLGDDGALFPIARSGSTTGVPAGYADGAGFSDSGLDGNTGTRDCNFFILHETIQTATNNAVSYETTVPTSDILAFENANHQNTYALDGANFGGQTFTAANNYSAITELWFQSATTVAMDDTASLEVTFWDNSNEAGNDWGLDTILPAADSRLIGTYSLPTGNLTAFGTWIRIPFDAADQAAIGILSSGQQYGFSISLGDSVTSFAIARSGSTTSVPAGYADGAGFSDSGLDGNTGTRDCNFFILGAIQGMEPGAPQSANDAYGIDEDGLLTVPAPGVLANDADPNNLPLSAHLDTAPAHGELTLNTNGSFTYRPNGNFTGADGFTYQACNGSLYSAATAVSITVTNLPDAPVAVADSYLATTNRTLSIPAPGVLRNDTEHDGDAMSAIKVSDPAHGTVTLNADGSFTYTPDTGFSGPDSFEYKVSDGALESPVATVSLHAAAQPNFIIIYADDMGFGDAGFNGYTDIHTPRLDALASGGVRFTQGYVCDSVCGPSRSGLMTGVYPARMGIIANPAADAGVPLSQPMISEMLKPKGYSTAVYGKWHLGSEEGLVRPLDRDFDHFFGFLDGAHDYYESNAEDPVWEDDQQVNLADYGYLTDAISDHAVDFIGQNTNNPFFLYVAYNAVHFPWQVPAAYIDRVAAAMTTIPEDWTWREFFAGMVLAMDDGVGRIMDSLEAYGLSENTLVFFITDNGSPEGQNYDDNTGDHMSSTGGFRGWKGDSYEGGIRVPFTMNWPGRIPAGLVYDKPVINLDAAATIAALAQAGKPTDFPHPIPAGMEERFPYPTFGFDGVNLMPYLTGQKQGRPHEKLYFRHNDVHAIIYGDLKLAWNDRTLEDRGDAVTEVDRVFDLSIDPFETTDLAPANPELTAMLKDEFRRWDCSLDPVVVGTDPGNRECMVASAEYREWVGMRTNDTRTSISGAYADLDGDGELNFVEYAFDEEPLTVAPGAVFQVQTNVRHGDSSISYAVLVGTDLETWDSVSLTYSAGSWTSSDPSRIIPETYIDNGDGTGRIILRTGSAYGTENSLFVRFGVKM
jgi:VCBS repeat-containing protein